MSDHMIAVKALNEMCMREPENGKRIEAAIEKMLAEELRENAKPRLYWTIEYTDEDGNPVSPGQVGPDAILNAARMIIRGQTAGPLNP